jgi:hypothetical protein
VEGADVGTDDATADRLALALAGAAGAVARVALGEEEADTVRDEDSLLQRETLLLNSPNAPRRAPHFFHHRSSAHDSVQFPCIQPDPVRPLTVVGRPVVSRRESGGVESESRGVREREKLGVDRISDLCDAYTQRERAGDTYVVTAGDPDDVALELVAELVGGDLLSHALLVKDAPVFTKTLQLAHCL